MFLSHAPLDGLNEPPNGVHKESKEQKLIEDEREMGELGDGLVKGHQAQTEEHGDPSILKPQKGEELQWERRAKEEHAYHRELHESLWQPIELTHGGIQVVIKLHVIVLHEMKREEARRGKPVAAGVHDFGEGGHDVSRHQSLPSPIHFKLTGRQHPTRQRSILETAKECHQT